MIEQVMRQFMRYQHCHLLFIHICQLQNGNCEEETLVQVHEHDNRVIVN